DSGLCTTSNRKSRFQRTPRGLFAIAAYVHPVSSDGFYLLRNKSDKRVTLTSAISKSQLEAQPAEFVQKTLKIN
ncbi:MAG: hypothetical protein ACKORJ_04140, partial [Bacteroidota bacterium]